MLAALPELDRQDAALEAALRAATDSPLPDGAQCSNCDHFLDYSGDELYTRILTPAGAFEYTNDQIGVCVRQMATSGYRADCPHCHHGRHKLPCHAHTSTRRTYNRCPNWEPNWDWLNKDDSMF